MSKLILSNLANLQNENTAVATINANNLAIETAMENTLSRDGTTPNQMSNNLDMNSNRIINLPEPSGSDEPARKIDLENAELAGGGTLLLPLSPGNGGTGISSYSKGDLIYALSSGTLTRLPAGVVGQALVQGAGPIPAWNNLSQHLPFLNASDYAGASLSDKIAAAIASADAPVTGCVIDARGINGVQNINSDITGGSAKPVTILLGIGTFTMTVGMSFQTGQTLLGMGIGKTTLRLGSSSGGMNGGLGPIVLNGSDVEFGNLTIDNPSAFSSGTATILLNSSTRSYVHHCRIIQTLPSSFVIMAYNGVTGSRIEHIYLEPGNATIHGIGIQNIAGVDGYNKVYNCHVHGGGFGYNLKLANANNFTNCSATATAQASLEGFNVETSNYNMFVNIYASGRGDNGFVEFNTSFENHIVGGTFFNNNLGGIYTTATDTVYEDCLCFNNNILTASLSSGMIIASDVSFGTAARITVNNLTCYDNQGSPTQKYGLHIYASVVGVKATGCRFRNNVTSDILNSGTDCFVHYIGNSGVFTSSDIRAVASLPSPTTAPGGRCQVADATTTTFGAVVAGGGGNPVPVYSDGLSWRIG